MGITNKPKIKVNVINTITNQILVEGCTINDAAAYTKTSYKGIQNAIIRGGRVKGKFMIIKTGEFFYAQEEPVKIKYDPLLEEWDRVASHPRLWKSINAKLLGTYGKKFTKA
jgi:hypothetical protein